ncbi:flagellar biosynthetic protein FliR [Desulfosarcina ovata subsp. sediminis]|uniref:Flagellar biosynthetic protein FliR n=1 Tax=Desulfosarcina ovata subsp. sediminis TaxID=885957 RepID=A0A5K7ZCB6_9BACT|nr:flagellar biosynthetic protein FliR [Desulfosarcina ovata]BBO79808.1 flagellar biosynthetic protein FliR [Desulfosarcina ovata subsp. sediminis]
MATLNIPLDAVYGVLLIFLRVAGIVFSAPVLDTSSIPATFKAGLALSVSILLLPTLNRTVSLGEVNLIILAMGVISEIGIGVTIGLSVKLLFTGIQLAGQIAGYQMGFAIANVVDPATSSQIPILGQIYNLTAMLLFLSVNAHHMFFSALVESFTIIPPLFIHIGPQLVGMMMKLAANMFVVAIKVGAPLIAVMLITSVSLGLVARTVPQMNIFIVAMPLKIVVGLFFMMITAPYLTTFLINLFASYRVTLFDLIRMMAGTG